MFRRNQIKVFSFFFTPPEREIFLLVKIKRLREWDSHGGTYRSEGKTWFYMAKASLFPVWVAYMERLKKWEILSYS